MWRLKIINFVCHVNRMVSTRKTLDTGGITRGERMPVLWLSLTLGKFTILVELKCSPLVRCDKSCNVDNCQ